MSKDISYIKRWLDVCCILIFIMILVGGATRLTQSGLSMVDWKPLMGIFPPLNDKQWSDSFDAYKQYPEYQKVNQFRNMDISNYKRIYYWEYAHRMLGRVIGLTFILPLIYFHRNFFLNSRLKFHMVMATLLVIFQGLLGWFMVKSGLIDNPHVSHYRLASHLFLAFILLAYTYCNRLTLNNNNNNNNKIDKSLFFHIKNLFILYIIQVLFGAFIAGTKAGLLWNTFPLMEGQLIPDGLLALNPFYLNFFENMKMFQFVHRLIGTLLVFYSGWFFIKSQKQFYNKYSGLLFMTLMMQFYIGIMTLILKVPLLFGVLHQAIAAIILLIIVHILFLMNNSKFINR